MTGTNPPPGNGEPPKLGGRHAADETAQWWERPASDGGPASPPSQADPTVLRGVPGQFDPYQSGSPQPYASGPSQPYVSGPSQPYVPAGPATPGQPYPSGQYGQPGPYGQQPYPGGQFQGGPPQQRNNTPLILGGIGAVVVVVVVIILVVALTSGGDGGGGGDEEKAWEGGAYGMADVTNACDLVDPSVLEQWSPTQESIEHTEDQPDKTYGGGRLNCRINNDGGGADGYNSASLWLNVGFASEYGDPSYEMWKDLDTKTSGTGRDHGDVAGIGEEAYYASYDSGSTYSSTFEYTVGAMDDNLSIQLELRLHVGEGETIDKKDVADVTKEQVEQVMAALKE